VPTGSSPPQRRFVTEDETAAGTEVPTAAYVVL